VKISNKRTKNFTKSKKYLSLIENSSVYDVANVSPITNATNLSNKLGHNVFLKREDLQPIFSFKISLLKLFEIILLSYQKKAIIKK